MGRDAKKQERQTENIKYDTLITLAETSLPRLSIVLLTNNGAMALHLFHKWKQPRFSLHGERSYAISVLTYTGITQV